MSVAITTSQSGTFNMLGLQMNDIVVQTIPGKETIFYVIDVNSFKKLEQSIYFKKIKIDRNKFVNPDCHKGVYTFSGTSEELILFLNENFENRIEIIPRYFFDERMKTFH